MNKAGGGRRKRDEGEEGDRAQISKLSITLKVFTVA